MNPQRSQRPLYVYVIAVAIVWAAILSGAWFLATHFKTLASVCGGFAIGMLAMYIAMRLYKWN